MSENREKVQQILTGNICMLQFKHIPLCVAYCGNPKFVYNGIKSTWSGKGGEYDLLKDTYVVFICPFDLFKQGLHRYTFQEMCLEKPGIPLGDGTTKVFLNASGTENDISEELKNFLDLIVGREVPEGKDEFIDRLQAAVRRARGNRKWRREYMMELMYKRDAYLIGKENGREEGLEEGLELGREEGRKLGREESKGRFEKML